MGSTLGSKVILTTIWVDAGQRHLDFQFALSGLLAASRSYHLPDPRASVSGTKAGKRI